MLGMELLTHNVFVSNTLLLLFCKKKSPQKVKGSRTNILFPVKEGRFDTYETLFNLFWVIGVF